MEGYGAREIEIGFQKTEIPKEKFERINNIFCEREHKESNVYECMPVYRDILVFKNQGEITGTAKICFECKQHLIVGTDLNTNGFGQLGGYGELYRVLHSQNQ